MDVYKSSDYAGGQHGWMSYYYGYETTACSHCGAKIGDSYNTCSCGCEETDWCFEVKKKGKTVFVKTSRELECEDAFDVNGCLIAGLMMYIEEIK